MKYYLAGPMTGLKNFGYDEFARASEILRNAGLFVLSPHEIYFGSEPGTLPYRAYIEAGLTLLMRADAIILMPGWSDSRGATLERHAALTMGMNVYYYVKEAPHLLTENPKEPDGEARTNNP